MEKRFTTHSQSGDDVTVQLKEMEECRSKTGELTTHVNKMKHSFCKIVKGFENDHNIQKVITSLCESTKKFNIDSKMMIEELQSLDKSLQEIENGTKSIVDVLTEYRDCKETLDDLDSLLKKRSTDGYDPQLDLELMGCDWTRYMESMHHDIEKVHNT